MKGISGFPRLLYFGMMATIAGAALAGCVRRGAPAPVEDRGGMFFGRGTSVPVARPATERPQPTAGTAVPPLVSKPGTVTVQSGDTLYGISRRNNVPIRAVINANNLTPPYNLTIGRQLVLPQQPYHVVAPGETIATIARAYNVSTQDLVRTNGIQPPYLIYVGEPILLPLPTAGGPATTAVATAPPVSAVPPPAPPAAPPSPSVVEAPPAPSAAAPPTPSSPSSPAPNPNPVPEASPQAGPPDATPPDALASLPPPTAPVEPPPINAPAGAFIWPVQGHVLSGFGPKPGGLVNDGINIAAPAGTPVRASQDGTVAYAGNELRGYGNLLLVRHDNGWVTAYAHNSELLVGRGDRVKRGQVISRVGATGSVGEPQLHFEIRQGTRSVDPARYLSGQGISGRT